MTNQISVTGIRFWRRTVIVLGLATVLISCSAKPQNTAHTDTQMESRTHAAIKPLSNLVGLIAPDTAALLEAWIPEENAKSLQGLFYNISPPGTALGSVTASPSQRDPNYYYHWVRDGSLVMGVIADAYERSNHAQDKNFLSTLLDHFVDFSRTNQLTNNLSGGLGEPKFNVNGTAFNGEWGRPQNDGPALRAITLIHYARTLLEEGTRSDYVKTKLYDSKSPTQSVIKDDLEFVAHHWQDDCFDLWEETKGTHFYARMVQRRALVEGAELAELLGDFSAAVEYRSQVKELSAQLLKHWDSARGYLVETLNWTGGNYAKTSGLDVGVVLGSLHGGTSDLFLSPGSDLIVATAHHIRLAFQNLYRVNQVLNLGTAIGRYPEDVYDGTTSGEHPGNPWVLATLGYAELYYRIASEWQTRGQLVLNATNLEFVKSILAGQGAEASTLGEAKGSDLDSTLLAAGIVLKGGTRTFDRLIGGLRTSGDAFLLRVKYHSPADGTLYEQMNRDNGFMQGAHDLAWSYASFLTAIAARQ